MYKNVDELKNIVFLNDDNAALRLNVDEKTYLNKYVRLEYFKNNLIEKKFLMFSPNNWIDPFEHIYYKSKKSKIIEDKYSFPLPNFHCLCLTNNSNTNEDATWTIYSYNSDKPVVKITYNLYELLKLFSSFCVKNDYTLYLGKIDYSLGENDIETLLDKNNPYHKDYFKEDFNLESYLRLLLLKRRQFQYEGEIRFFLVNNKTAIDDNVLTIENFDYTTEKLIRRIKFSPLRPASFIDPNTKSYKKRNTANADKLRVEISPLLPNLKKGDIQQCHLYEPR